MWKERLEEVGNRFRSGILIYWVEERGRTVGGAMEWGKGWGKGWDSGWGKVEIAGVRISVSNLLCLPSADQSSREVLCPRSQSPPLLSVTSASDSSR